MINRVNKAPVLRLVTSQAKQSENDPGSSQGNGMMYDGPPQKKEEPVEPSPVASEAPEIAVAAEVVHIQKAKEPRSMIKSLNAVYEEFFKKKKKAPSVGLTTQYSDDHSTAKGMLLNKKAE